MPPDHACQERTERVQADHKADALAELHSKADRSEARTLEQQEQARRVSEDHPHPVAKELKDAIQAAHH